MLSSYKRCSNHLHHVEELPQDTISSSFLLPAPSTSIPSISSPEPQKKLVMIYHDKSIFNTNEGQTWM